MMKEIRGYGGVIDDEDDEDRVKRDKRRRMSVCESERWVWTRQKQNCEPIKFDQIKKLKLSESLYDIRY